MDPDNTMPGTAVTAAPCAALQPRSVPHSRSDASFDHTSAPVSRRTARMPPGVLPAVPLTLKYAWRSSAAPPHCPPIPPPGLDRYSHTLAPLLSGSKP